LSDLSCERDERILFEHIDLNIRSGDIYQVLGANGVGKTTLFKTVVGLITPAAGEVIWRQNNTPRVLRESLLYLGHYPAVNTSLTALENLSWYFGLNGSKGNNTTALMAYTQALETVGLAGYENVRCFQMSAGQQRRVALARLYVSQAPVWILDEPFTAIDTRGVADLEVRIVEHANHGGLVILTSHQQTSLPNLKTLNLSEFVPTEHFDA